MPTTTTVRGASLPQGGLVFDPIQDAKDQAILKQGAEKATQALIGDRVTNPTVAARGQGAATPRNPLASTVGAFDPQPETPEVADASTGGGVGLDAGKAGELIQFAKTMLGVPYKWGGTTSLGVDCSGFTQLVYKRFGINLPRVSYQQATVGPRVALSALKPGDMVFWDNSSRNPGADHVEIYIGRDAQGRQLVIGAPAPGKTVRIRTLGASDSKAWGVSMGLASVAGAVTKSNSTVGGSSASGVDAYLAALRRVESNNNYKSVSKYSSASGAYQYIDSTWNNYGGYRRAYLAPASVQDARARADALAIFKKFGNWEQVAAYHLYPAWASNRAMWSRSPGGINPTVQTYVNKVMGYMRG